ncbi:ketopantoate reductase family protein [Sinorhizobium psoraleae]|uniref:2-dehydropantoate 2-reductase n=1 Tax=Sinorhizobium psoraleae TaxID=520838 RepID=A0ABT4KLW7_9HYPH|nr:2-dehydropantoate 2-reductase [Sinorhizobium psoraleae]MCZ4092341.1 2-dehydropantoate 2-reductase [Sinorhizobium psoraleae]
MRIAVMGSGGIGGYIGLRLAKAGEDVTFIARGEHLYAMRSNGLRLESPLGDVSLPGVTATDDPAEVGTVDLVIFAVKLYDSEEAAAAILPMVGPKTTVLTLQNGVDGVDLLARSVPRSQVVAGAIYISTYLEAPGLIKQTSGMTQMTVGGRNDPAIAAFRDACALAEGISLQAVDDVDPVLWMKFVTLAAFSGGTSLMRSGIGAIIADPEGRIFMEQLRDEGMAIAAAKGHPMPDGYVQQTTSLWQMVPPETQSSMANDLQRGKRLELEWLSGRMHSFGKELEVPTPAHTAVYRALHLYANGAPAQ